jgi:hypothetical protein
MGLRFRLLFEQMTSKQLLFSCFCLLFSGSALYSQQAPSLGEIARRQRAAKQSEKPAAGPTAGSNSTQSAPLNSQPSSTHPGGGHGVPDNDAVPKAKATPQAESTAKALGDDLNLHYLDHYEAAIRQHFEKEEFELLDKLAATARSTKARLPGGFWTIHIIYDALMQPSQGTYKATDADFTAHIEHLNRWVAQRPKSITARVALAGAYTNYAANARGGGYANTVSEDGWRLYAERSATAGKILAEAFELPEKCPEWYLEMQGVINAQDGSPEMQKAMFEKAVAFEPEYHYYYRLRADHLLPKWGGNDGDAAAFAAEAADRLGGKKGDMLYYQIGSFLNCGCDNDRLLNGMSWPRIKKGYAAVEELYGVSLQNLNKMAMMAAMAGDPEYAEEALARIGENWVPETWRTREYFDEVREWSKGASVVKSIEAAIKAADANLTTPEGRKFDGETGKSFAAHYSTAVADCQKKSGDPFLIPFDLLIQVGKTGAVEQVYSTLRTHVSECLKPQVQKGQFPSPPLASYWVKVHLQPSAEEIQKLKAAGMVR